MSTVSSSTERNYENMIGNPNYVPKKAGEYNAVFENDVDNSIGFEDFFSLMLQQLSNQDFMNPMDDTQYLTQLAQIATMKAMEEISYYGKANFAMSYLGKEVTAAKNNIGGTVSKETGIVTQISLLDGDYLFTVNGKQFSLKEIMLVHELGTGSSTGSGDDTDDGETENTNTDT